MSKQVKTSKRFTINDIVRDVQERGDDAIAEWAKTLDLVDDGRPVRAVPTSDVPSREILFAADAIRRWHEAQMPTSVRLEVNPGVELERRFVPLESVGVYVPSGLVSSLLMGVIPAQVAGVEKIVVCTPPHGASVVAGAAALIGIDEVWIVGGAQAIAAMAYGTQTIPKVDKIVGPGGAAVNEAKLIVSRDVGIDLPAGPSEVVVVADAEVSDELIAQEVAAQMEHGPDSRAFVVRPAGDLDATVREIDGYAAEHVALIGRISESLAPRIRNAGSIFVGRYAPVPAGDYATGANHVLPTGEWSRSTGGLGVETFLKPITTQRISKEGLNLLAPVIEALADVEGMPQHKATARR